MSSRREQYTKVDAAKDTDSKTSEVSEAWHGARDDAEVRNQGGERGPGESDLTQGSQAQVQATEQKFGLPEKSDE